MATDYGRPERKKPSLHGRKFTPTPKSLGTAKAYFVCHFTDRNFVDNFLQVVIYLALVANI